MNPRFTRPVEGDPLAPVLLWAGPDWGLVDPLTAFSEPAFFHDHAALRDQCRVALRRREQSYPELVAKGRMDAATAEQDIAGWKLLLAEWDWICTGAGPCPGKATLPQRQRAVETALDRIDGEFDRGIRTKDLFAQMHLNRSMLLHLSRLDPSGEPTIHRLARINRTLRHQPEERKAA